MKTTASRGATVPEASHHTAEVNGTMLHYVSAGAEGPPVLLVHGFPESWWAFHALIPLLAERHRVFAVDLRGFGDSKIADDDFDSAVAAEDLHQLIGHLGLGPMHLSVQDVSGGAVFRLAHAHPDDVLSVTAIESGLGGFGAEVLADGGHGGAWYIAALITPGVPDVVLRGRETAFLGELVFGPQSASPDAVSPSDVEEFVRGYARPGGWAGAIGLYRAMLQEGEELVAMVERAKLAMPVLAVGGSGGPFTAAAFGQVTQEDIVSVQLDDVGHYVAMEAPRALADAMLEFLRVSSDQSSPSAAS